MAVTSYPYTKFVNLKRLKSEITSSAIVTAYDHCVTDGESFDLFFKDALSAGDKTILDGLVTDHVNEPLPESTPVTSTNIPKVAVYDGEGEGESIPSHDWTDKTTWYFDSLRSTGVALVASGDKYKLGQYNIIDITHGKLTFEDELLQAYALKVYDDGTELTEGTDYTCEYGHGKITLIKDLDGPFTADYSYAQSSVFAIKIPDGKTHLKIKEAEVNFTSDIQMKHIIFELGFEHPNTGWNPVYVRTYKNIKDLINIARAGKGAIPRVDILHHDVLIFPIKYLKNITLHKDYGLPLELRCRINDPDNDPILGEFATITFYTEIDA